MKHIVIPKNFAEIRKGDVLKSTRLAADCNGV